MTELDKEARQADGERIAELEREVARLQAIEHGLERAASHAQRVAARLQSVLDTTVDAIITIGERGVIQTVNPATLAMFGYSEVDLIGQNVSMLMPDPDHTAHNSYLSSYVEGGPPKIIGTGRTTTAKRSDDTLFPIDLSISEAWVEGRRVFTGIVRDVSARVEANLRLSDSQSRFRALYDGAPMGISVVGLDRAITGVNPALQAMLGYAEDEFIGKRLTAFWYPGAEQEDTHTHTQLIAGTAERISYSRVLQNSNGDAVWVRISASSIPDENDQRIGVVRLIEDVTEQHHAEEKRLAQEELLRTIVDNAPLGIALVAPSREILKVNPAIESILGYPGDQIEGKQMSAFMGAKANTGIYDLFANGDINFDQRERQLLKSDGTQVNALVTNSVVRNDDGSIKYLVRMFDDITDRRDAERGLEVSESRFRALFEAAPTGLLIKDANNQIVSTNSKVQDLLGRTGGELEGTRIRDYMAPGFQPTTKDMAQRLVRGETHSYEAVAQLANANGESFWVQGNQTAVRDADGNFLYSIQSLEDISERILAEQTLQASEERFRQLFESSPLGIAVYGPDRTIERINSALSQMLGRNDTELLGRRLPEFWHPDFTSDSPSSGDRIVAGDLGSQVYERHFQKPDGSSIWAKVTASPFHSEADGRLRVMRTLDDISAEKRAAGDLRASENRFRSLFDSTPVGIALVAADATITAVNPALEQLLGYPGDEIVGRTLSAFRSPKDTGTGQHRTLALADGTASTATSERLQLRKDGSEVWTQVVTAPVRDDDDNYLFGVRMVVDISERKEVERLKDEFLGMVSHELRTPLTAIEAGVGLVASGALGPLSDKVQHMLDIAAENSDRLTRLVNDVLDMERMNAGRIELNPMECHSSVLIEQAAHAVSAVAHEQGVTIDTSRVDIRFFADPDRIVQTLINLTANAVKFSESGATVSVTSAKADSATRFAVSDSGRGIPASQIPLVFDRFHQVETGDSRNRGGTGLGLAICRWIVDQHGGRIWVESVADQGSTFFFELPDR